MVKGEPIYTVTSNRQNDNSSQDSARRTIDPTRHESGHKIHPQVRITNLKTSRNGARMETYAFIRNDSPYEIEARGIRLMGQNTPLRVSVPSSGTSRSQVKIYSGNIAHNDAENDAHLDFLITSNGDYFQQKFDVEFDRQSDNTYLIEELHAEDYVRDT